MIDHTVYLTVEGKAQLEQKLHHLLTVRRPEVADRIHNAKADGDISDSGEYDDAKNEQAMVEGQIRDLEHKLGNSQIIADTGSRETVALGCTVVVREDDGTEERYSIVGSAEANARQRKVSNESPTGRALMGHKIGDTVNVSTPGGLLKLTIVTIE